MDKNSRSTTGSTGTKASTFKILTTSAPTLKHASLTNTDFIIPMWDHKKIVNESNLLRRRSHSTTKHTKQEELCAWGM